MSHRDLKEGPFRTNSCDLRVALQVLLRGIDWAPIQLRKDCTWTAELLATTALLWAWSDELTLIDRFWAVRRIVLHLFPQSGEVANTYQAFTKILRRWTTELVGLLQRTLRERMQRDLVDCWLVLGFAMFGVDGSRAELPRTRSHECVFFLPQEASLPQLPPTEKSVGPPLEEVKFSPVVAHDDVACRDGFALGLADRSGRQQRTCASLGNAVGPAGGISRGRRRRLRRLRIHPGGPRQRASPAAAGRIARPTPETARLRSGVCKYRVSLARARGQTTPAPAGFTTGRGSRWQTSGVSCDQYRFQTPAHGPTGRRVVCSPLGCRAVLSPF